MSKHKPVNPQQMHMINLMCDFSNSLLEDEIISAGLWDGVDNSTRPKITKGLLCKLVGVTQKTLGVWLHDENYEYFRVKLDEMHKLRFKDFYKNVDKKLIEKAMKGDTTAMKLFYQLNGMLDERSTVKIIDKAPTQIIINEYKEPTSDENKKDDTLQDFDNKMQ